MYYVQKTSEFDKWLKKLPDLRAKAKVLFRLQKLENDEHFGDFKTVGDGIIELRIDYAQGYRIYLKEIDKKLIILFHNSFNLFIFTDISIMNNSHYVIS